MELAENVFVIYGPEFGKYPFSNSIYIKDHCLIDSGAGEALLNLHPKVIFNSHWHEDHICLNKIGEKIYAHELDAPAIQSYEEFKRRYGIGDLCRIFANFEFGNVDETFEDGDYFEFGKTSLEIIHTPGHSAGHCCFLINGEILFLADIELSFPWYGCLDCNLNDFIESIKKLKKMASEIKIAIPSHGKVVEKDLEIKLQRYEDKILEREKKILELLEKGQKIEGIVYKRLPEPREIYESFEKVMIQEHLEKLRICLGNI